MAVLLGVKGRESESFVRELVEWGLDPTVVTDYIRLSVILNHPPAYLATRYRVIVLEGDMLEALLSIDRNFLRRFTPIGSCANHPPVVVFHTSLKTQEALRDQTDSMSVVHYPASETDVRFRVKAVSRS